MIQQQVDKNFIKMFLDIHNLNKKIEIVFNLFLFIFCSLFRTGFIMTDFFLPMPELIHECVEQVILCVLTSDVVEPIKCDWAEPWWTVILLTITDETSAVSFTHTVVGVIHCIRILQLCEINQYHIHSVK